MPWPWTIPPDGIARMARGARGEGNRKTPGDTTPASTFAAFFVGLLSAGWIRSRNPVCIRNDTVALRTGSDVLGSQLGPGHCQPVIDSDWKIGFGFVVANWRVGRGTGSRFDDEFVSTLPDTSLSSIIPGGAGVIDMTGVTGDSIRLHSEFVSFILEMFHRDLPPVVSKIVRL